MSGEFYTSKKEREETKLKKVILPFLINRTSNCTEGTVDYSMNVENIDTYFSKPDLERLKRFINIDYDDYIEKTSTDSSYFTGSKKIYSILRKDMLFLFNLDNLSIQEEIMYDFCNAILLKMKSEDPQ
jgi:hypothetical protein